MKRVTFLITLLAALTFTAAGAVVSDLPTVLPGSNLEPVPNVSVGTAELMLEDLTNPLTINETFTGLPASAHPDQITPACGSLPGVTLPAQLPLRSDFPTSGIFMQTYNPATAPIFGGGFSEGGPITGLKAGLAYSDIREVNLPGGEIPGQRIAASTPEPSTWAMMLIGFAGIGFAGYRNYRRATAPKPQLG